MTTQDGYDWPTPHPVAPVPLRMEPQRPRWKCATCADTGVIRYQPTFGTAGEWRSRIERCQVCGPK
jgi:hypothetical protein